MSRFGRALRERQPDPAGRRWLFVPYDQRADEIGPLSRDDPRTLGIVLVETLSQPAVGKATPRKGRHGED